jgi:hypothetical protein
MRRDSSLTIQCIEKLAKHGAKWQPKERYRHSQFRRALYRVEKWRALDVLNKLLAAEAFGDGAFRELMSTPKIRELLSNGYRNTDKIPEAAGLVGRGDRCRKSGRAFHRRSD